MLLPPGLRDPGCLCLMPQPVCYALLNRLPWHLQSTAAMPLNAMSQAILLTDLMPPNAS